MNSLRYILYARKSSEDAERQSLSIPAQARKLREMFPGIKIVATLEESRSAFEPGRPVFAKVMDMIKNGEADGILSWHPDRLSRNEIDAANITYAIRRGFIQDLKFGSYHFNNSPDGIMMLQSMMSQSQYYSAKLSVDVKRGNEQQRKNGWLTYRALPGYLNARNPNNPDQGIIIADEDRHALIRKMWDMLLSGNYSVPMIQKIANDEWGYRTPVRRRSGGTPMTRSTLYLLFTNIRYTGLIPVPGKLGEYEKANYPAMVTMEEYDKAQIILGNKGKPRQSVVKEFAYRGFLFCKECGCSVTAQDKYKRLKNGTVLHYIYYHCTRKRPCDNRKTVEEKNLAGQLDALLDSYTIHPQFEEWALEAIKEMNGSEAEERKAIENTQFSTLQQMRQQHDKLIDMASKELIRDEVFKEKSKALLSQIKDMEDNVADTTNRAASWREGLHKTIDVIAHGRERFEKGDITAKRDILLALGSNPTLYGGKIELMPFEWLIPIQKGLPALKAEYEMVRTSDSGSAEEKTAAIAGIKTKWLGW
ncbi:recombinase family protein [Candidatus Saccharibacteria bacterium]|nr:recombinase family protein [Candidatus Saccharibacteria bacterium]